jgi:hypothetical protein
VYSGELCGLFSLFFGQVIIIFDTYADGGESSVRVRAEQLEFY